MWKLDNKPLIQCNTVITDRCVQLCWRLTTRHQLRAGPRCRIAASAPDNNNNNNNNSITDDTGNPHNMRCRVCAAVGCPSVRLSFPSITAALRSISPTGARAQPRAQQLCRRAGSGGYLQAPEPRAAAAGSVMLRADVRAQHRLAICLSVRI